VSRPTRLAVIVSASGTSWGADPICPAPPSRLELLAPCRTCSRPSTTYAIAKVNVIIHDLEAEIVIGDTQRKPNLLNGSKWEGFDLVADAVGLTSPHVRFGADPPRMRLVIGRHSL